MKTAPARRAAVAAAAALLLSSCGSLPSELDFLKGQHEFLDQSPRGMAKASFADMQDVTSMRILGDVDVKRFGRMQVDISVGEDGCRGSFDTGSDGGFELRQNEDGTWLRADERFVRAQVDARQGDQVWKLFRGKWFATGDDGDYADLCSLEDVLADFELEPEDTETSLSSEDVVEVGDSDTVPITGGRGRKRSTIWVSLDAPHYVLKMAPAKDKGLPDALFFEEFGADVVIETPSKKEILVLPKGQSPV